jgi:2,4-dienoyl-CoA reductase (NADPH2)
VSQYKHLFEPLKIGRVELKNRIMCLAMGTGIRINNGEFSDDLIAFYATRVSGGAALGMVPVVPIYPGPSLDNIFQGVYEDRLLPGLRKMADAIHAHDAKAGAQMFVMDDHYTRGKGHPTEVVGPTDLPKPRGPKARALTVDELEQLVEDYSDAAVRAREAGFDIVEFHFGIGYLPSKFVSPLTNTRTDEYGGTLEKRMKFPLDIMAAAKRKLGDDYPIVIRFAGDELFEGGHNAEDAKQVAKYFEEAGAALLDVQCGWHETPIPMIQMSVPRGRWAYLPEGIKKQSSIPVAAAYRINHPDIAEEILATGKADLIGMARALICDPELPNKAKEGRVEDIRVCTACCYCLDLVHMDIYVIENNFPVRCAINVEAGMELKHSIKPAAEPKMVAVIGGGPAGMEFARVASLRGHKVTLYEKENKLGGCLNLATLPPDKEELENLPRYLEHSIRQNGVEIRLSEEFTDATLERDKPEVVVVATGRTAPDPDIPGADGPNVVTCWDVLIGAKEVGDRVLIVGGSRSGPETADFLQRKGKQVTIFDKDRKVGLGLGPTSRWCYMLRFYQVGVRMIKEAEVVNITAKGVEVSRAGNTEFYEGDTVVLATGSKSNNALAGQLKGKVWGRFVTIGDCVEPHGIPEAMEAAYKAACEI